MLEAVEKKGFCLAKMHRALVEAGAVIVGII